MHHDILERSLQMDVQTNTAEAIHDVGANMEISSSESLESPRSESTLTKQVRKCEQVPVKKFQIQQVIVNNISPSISSSVCSSPCATIVTTSPPVLPKTSTPVKCIVRTVPKDISVQSVVAGDATKGSPISTQFVKIAPQPQVSNLIRAPLHIWTTTGNVTRIIQCPANSLSDNKSPGQADLSANMKEIERKFFKTGGVGKRRVNLETSNITTGIPKGVFYGTKVTTPTTHLTIVNATGITPPKPSPPPKRKSRVGNSRRNEPVCLTISSDDEEDNELKIPAPKKERITPQDKTQLVNRREMMRDKDGSLLPNEPGNTENLSPFIQLPCRSIRIGSYKISPEHAQPVIIQKEKIIITVPVIGDENHSVSIQLSDDDIVSVLAHLGKQMPALFIYTTDVTAGLVRSRLNMTDKGGYYLDPRSSDESQKRITILPSLVDETQQQFLRRAFFGRKLSEIDHKVANMILVRSTANLLNLEQLLNSSPPKNKPIENLLTYPPPPQTGGISVTSEDLECLKEGGFLNDVIIDFYLKYLVNEVLSEKDKARTHVFSSFFYNCLTQKALHRDIFEDTNKTLSERRHKKVKTWTRHVDIFEKDFIIIPINQRAHWFLAIICFPGMVPELKDSKLVRPQLLASQQNKNAEESLSKQPEQMALAQIEPQYPPMSEEDSSDPLASQLSLGAEEFAQEEDSMQCEESEESMNTEEPEEPIPPAVEKQQSNQIDHGIADGVIKKPCILIFDSLMGSSRWRIMTTLREYLSVEWQVKKGTPKLFTKTTMAGYSPQVPQQTNYSDCGIYLLQYVQSFFETPITAYNQQMNLKDWFSTELVMKKRTEIQELIQRLSNEQRQVRSDATMKNEGISVSADLVNNGITFPTVPAKGPPLQMLQNDASLPMMNQT